MFCFVLLLLCFETAASWQQVAVTATLPVLDWLNLVQHLQPKCLEDRFLPPQTRRKGPVIAQSLQHISSHPSGSPQTIRHLASSGKGDPSPDGSSELSLQGPRLQGNFSIHQTSEAEELFFSHNLKASPSDMAMWSTYGDEAISIPTVSGAFC